VTIISIVFFGAFAGWLGYEVVCAVLSGVAQARGGFRFQRTRQPVMFWSTVAVQIGFAVLFFGLMLTRLISK
jgi:hypothetical protein